VIDSSGALWVATSLQPKGKVYDTQKRTGYEGVWCHVPNVDEPYVSTAALLERLARLEWFFAVPGTLRLGPQNAQGSGGEIQLADGKGGLWSIDATNGELRIFLNGPAGKVALKLTG
jgi:hypothetical protein